VESGQCHHREPPYILGETYNSFVYTNDTKTVTVTVTNGGIVWVEGDVQAPGTKVVTGEVFVRAVNEDGTVGARFTGEILNLKWRRSQTFVFAWPGPFVAGDTTWEVSVEAFAASDPDPDNNKATATTSVVALLPESRVLPGLQGNPAVLCILVNRSKDVCS